MLDGNPSIRAQVVGWPPVRSYRKNILAANNHQKSGGEDGGDKAAVLVKVSMDGAPYLRKVDLGMYKSYQELSDALAKMFGSFTIGTHQSSFPNNTYTHLYIHDTSLIYIHGACNMPTCIYLLLFLGIMYLITGSDTTKKSIISIYFIDHSKPFCLFDLLFIGQI